MSSNHNIDDPNNETMTTTTPTTPTLLANMHINRKGSDLLNDINQDKTIDNDVNENDRIPVNVMLPNTTQRNMKGQDLYDITTKINDLVVDPNNKQYVLTHNVDLRNSQMKLNMDELYHHDMINQRLENDAKEIATNLLHRSHKKRYKKIKLIKII